MVYSDGHYDLNPETKITLTGHVSNHPGTKITDNGGHIHRIKDMARGQPSTLTCSSGMKSQVNKQISINMNA